MKKFLLIVFFILAGAGIAGALAWVYRADVAAQLLARELGVPVTIDALSIHPQGSEISQVWIGNPPHSRTPTAFSAKQIAIQTTFPQLVADPLLIDEIVVSDILIGVEYYDSKKRQNNWQVILGEPEASPVKSSRDYLIRTLRLERMEIQIVQANGSKKTYTLPMMEFHNISAETGFPVGEIEKAIFKQVLQGLIQQLNLNQLFNGAIPIPKGIPIPFWP